MMSPSWISRTWSPGRMNRRSWVTTTRVQPRFCLLLAKQGEDLVTPFAVEVAGRLIGEQDHGILDQGAGNCHSLLLASGELGRLVAQPVARARPVAAGPLPWRAASGETPSGMNGSSTLPTAVRLGIRLNCWKTKPSF